MSAHRTHNEDGELVSGQDWRFLCGIYYNTSMAIAYVFVEIHKMDIFLAVSFKF